LFSEIALGEISAVSRRPSPVALLILVLLTAPIGTLAAADLYGAFAYSAEDGKYGYAFDFPEANQADQRAHQECSTRSRGNCEVVLSFRNGCGALARGQDKGYGAAWARRSEDAAKAALDGCRQNSAGCRVADTVCTSNVAPATRVPPAQRAPPVATAPPSDLPPEVAAVLEEFDIWMKTLPDNLWELLIGPAFGLLIAFLVLRNFIRAIKAAIPAALRQQIDQAARTGRATRSSRTTPTTRRRPESRTRSASSPLPRRTPQPPIQDHNLIRRHLRTRTVIR